MAIQYRRKIGTPTWHFDQRCLLWPNGLDFLVLYDRPHDQQTCDDCIALGQHDQRAAATPAQTMIDSMVPTPPPRVRF
jgi:hypothetical protein